MKILIAEDDRISRTFMGKFMSKYGDCEVAVDGMEALDIFMDAFKKGEPFDLACLDVMMPKVDGLKLLKVIRTLENQHKVAPEKKVKIIMMTALADVDYVDQAFKLGCDAYAPKPVDTKKVVEVLHSLGLIKD